MATKFYAPGGETFAQVAIGINVTNDYLLPSQQIDSGDNLTISLPFGKSATRWAIYSLHSASNVSLQTTNDTITDVATADAATWVEITTVNNGQNSGIIESPVGGIRVVVGGGIGKHAHISFLTQTQGRNNLG